jgi:hypothetical protein
MTVETDIPSTIFTVAGTGPYAVAWPIEGGDVTAMVLVDGAWAVLDPAEFTATPAGGSATITLTSPAATTHAGRSLLIERATAQEQGWEGLSSRELGLEASIDRITRAVQDISARSGQAIRVPGAAMRPSRLTPGRAAIWDGDRFVDGPNATEVAGAQTFAERAEGAADRAEAVGIFDTRAEYRAWLLVGNVVVPDRSYIVAGLSYLGSPGATATGLPGLVPNGVATPQHFGVVGDGVTDDTLAMQSWFYSADCLTLPDGNYLITAPLTRIGAPFSVEGAGKSTARIICDDCNGLEINADNSGADDRTGNVILRGFSIVCRNNSGGRSGLFLRGGHTQLGEEGVAGPLIDIQVMGEDANTAFTIGIYLLTCGYANLAQTTVIGARNDYSLMQYGICLAGGNDITAFGHRVYWADVGISIGYPGSGSAFFTVEGTSWVAGHIVGVRRAYEILTGPPGDHHSIIGGHINAMETALYCDPTPGNVSAQCVFHNVNVLKMTPRLNLATPKANETGTVVAATINTVTLAVGAPSTNMVGRAVYISTGTGDTQYRRITAYDAETRVATLDQNWSVIPNNTSTYWIEWVFHGIRGFRFSRLKVTSSDFSRGSGSPYDTSIDLLDGCENCFVVGNVLDIGICSIANVNTQITRGTAPVPHTIYGNKSSLGVHIDQAFSANAPSGATSTINGVEFGTGNTKTTISARGYGTPIDIELVPKGTGRIVFANPVVLRAYTVATRPLAATAGPGAIIFVSDAVTGAQFQGATSGGWVNLG